MKHLFTLFLSLYTLIPAVAQFTYTGGPEGYNITHLAARGDSLLAVHGNQVYLNGTSSNKQWVLFSQGLYSQDSLVRAFQTFRGQFFIAQGRKVFALATGSNRWQDLSKGIKVGQIATQFINFQDREFLVRCFDTALQQYYWYQYDVVKKEWVAIDPQAVVGLSPALAILPNGNLLAYTAGASTAQQYRARFDASTRQWRRVDTLSLAVFNSVVALSNTELLAGGTSSGNVYRSTDGGKVWTLLKPAPVPATGRSVSVYKANTAVYAVATEYIGRSIDGGKTWKEVNDFAFISSSSPFVGNDSSSYVIAQGVPFFHLNTPQLEGAFSIELNPPFNCTNVLLARDNIFFYGRGGIFSFDDSQAEVQISSYTGNLPRVPLSSTGLYKAGTDVVGIADFGFYRYTAAQGWRLAMDSLNLFIPYINARGVATRQDTVVLFDAFSSYYSTNRGQIWREIDDTPYLFTFQGFANGSKSLFAGYDGQLYRWLGNKQAWEELKRPGNNLLISGLLTKDDTLMVPTSSGWFYTLDAGQQWKTMTAPATSVFFYFSSGAGAYAAEFSSASVSSKLYEINARGTTQRVLLNIPANVRLLNIASRDSFILALPTPNQGFLYFSSNRGRSWRNLDTRSLGFVNNALFDGDKVYLGGTTGVWTMPLSRLTTGIFDPKPLAASTLQAWPNPSTGKFVLNDPDDALEGDVQVKVYNTLGQLVHEQQLQAWKKGFELDLSRQTAGQYWLLLNNGEKTWSAKLIKQ